MFLSKYILPLLIVPAFPVHADIIRSISWDGSSTESYDKHITVENCGKGSITHTVGREITHTHTIQIDNSIKGSASISVPFNGARINVGTEIERSFSQTYGTVDTEFESTSFSIPSFSAPHRKTITITESWKHGTLSITDDGGLLGKSRTQRYPIKRIAQRYISQIKGEPISCLRDEWREERKQVMLENFSASSGDCEMDTDNNDHVRLNVNYLLLMRGDKVTGSVAVNIFEGRGSKYGDTIMTDSTDKFGRNSYLFAHRPGWKIVDIDKNTDVRTRRYVINKGKTRAGWMKPPAFNFQGTAIESVWYNVDAPGGNDCKIAASQVTIVFRARWKEQPENRY